MNPLLSLMLRMVPRRWRDDVVRDLTEERPGRAGSLWLSAQVLAIGLRLRAEDLTWRPGRLASHRSRPMQDLFRDFALAVRGALRRPSYSLAVIATLAIGIGANTAIFSVFNWILLRPLPGVERPEELVTIKFQTAGSTASYFISYRDYAELRDAVNATLTGMAAAVPMKMEMATGDTTSTISAEVVTWNYLSLLGVQIRPGRDFTVDEDAPGGPASAIISHALWRGRYSRNPAAIGSTLTLNGRPFTIVGVAAPGFQGRSMVTVADVWLPIASYGTLMPAAARQRLLDRQQTLFGDAFARRRPGATLAQAQAEAGAAVAGLPDFANRSRSKGARAGIGPVLYSGIGHESYALQRLTTVFRLLMAAVGLLLVLACANAANLLLARSTARRREIAVCQAVGASRWRIIRQQLIEGLVLALGAGVLGLGLAACLTWMFDGMRIVAFLPAVSGVSLDWRVAMFATAAAFATGLLFAAAPAAVSSRVDLLPALRDAITTTPGARRWLRGTLVVVQITVSVVLLFGAGLFLRTLQNIRGIDLGIEPEGLVSFGIQPSRFGMSADRSSAYLEQLLERLRHAPGVTSAAFTWTTSFSSNRNDATFIRDDGTKVSAARTDVSPKFFETMGIQLLAGRDFTEWDAQESDKSGVMIVSRSLAEKLFPGGGALGSRVKLNYPEGKIVEIVGIAEDIRDRTVTREPEAWTYAPAVKPTWGTIQVRSPLPAVQVAAIIRETARGLDPVVGPHDIETFGATVDRALSEQRLFAKISTIFAMTAAVLAALGIYSMMAGAVTERRKEFGIRLALGAAAGAMFGLVVRGAVALGLTGVILGLGISVALSRVIESRLFGVSPLDPLMLVSAALTIVALCVMAALLPAARAARVDPVQSLRVE